jgi:hypothetical protein
VILLDKHLNIYIYKYPRRLSFYLLYLFIYKSIRRGGRHVPVLTTGRYQREKNNNKKEKKKKKKKTADKILLLFITTAAGSSSIILILSLLLL